MSVRVNIKYAVMGFCSDLTDPSGIARPVAVVGAAQMFLPRSNKKEFAFYVLRNDPESDPAMPQDKLTRSMLQGLKALFDRQILGGLAEAGAVGFVQWLQDRFRNSLHVDSIGRRQIEVREEIEVHVACMKLYPELVLHSRTSEPVRRRLHLPAETPPAFMLADGYSFGLRPMEGKRLQAVGG
jgi:hypothetical protein